VILYNHNSFTEIKNFRWSWPLKSSLALCEIGVNGWMGVRKDGQMTGKHNAFDAYCWQQTHNRTKTSATDIIRFLVYDWNIFLSTDCSRSRVVSTATLRVHQYTELSMHSSLREPSVSSAGRLTDAVSSLNLGENMFDQSPVNKQKLYQTIINQTTVHRSYNITKERKAPLYVL